MHSKPNGANSRRIAKRPADKEAVKDKTAGMTKKPTKMINCE